MPRVVSRCSVVGTCIIGGGVIKFPQARVYAKTTAMSTTPSENPSLYLLSLPNVEIV